MTKEIKVTFDEERDFININKNSPMDIKELISVLSRAIEVLKEADLYDENN